MEIGNAMASSEVTAENEDEANQLECKISKAAVTWEMGKQKHEVHKL